MVGPAAPVSCPRNRITLSDGGSTGKRSVRVLSGIATREKWHFALKVLGSVLPKRLAGLTGHRPLPPRGLGRKHDSGARFRIRPGIMVAQPDAEPPADIGQTRRVDAPLGARELHRACERQSRRANSVHAATGSEHTSVKTRVVGCDELGVIEPREHCQPEFAEGGRVAYILPMEAMNVGELKPRRRRPYQERTCSLNFPVAPLGEAHRAGTDPLSVGSLEIDSDERIHGSRRYHMAFRMVQVRGGQQRSLQSSVHEGCSEKMTPEQISA